jgi:ParB family chromosome partitioning protein
MVEETLEILSGHNRVNAAKLAGLSEVPTINLGEISDELAMVYIVETNLIQRSFADMLHSEKDAVGFDAFNQIVKAFAFV